MFHTSPGDDDFNFRQRDSLAGDQGGGRPNTLGRFLSPPPHPTLPSTSPVEASEEPLPPSSLSLSLSPSRTWNPNLSNPQPQILHH